MLGREQLVGLHAHRLADAAGAHRGERLAEQRRRAQHQADEKTFLPILGKQVRSLPALFRGDHHRLLAEHLGAGFQRIADVGQVQVIGRADHHRVRAQRGEHLAVVGEAAASFGHAGQAGRLGIDIGPADELQPVASDGLQVGEDVADAATEADDREAHGGVLRSGRSGLTVSDARPPGAGAWSMPRDSVCS